MSQPLVAEDTAPCPYSPCTGTGEREVADGCSYEVCGSCGGTWDYQLEREPADTCQMGLPIGAQAAAPGQVFLTIGRRPE